jgi:hypothetical protein
MIISGGPSHCGVTIKGLSVTERAAPIYRSGNTPRASWRSLAETMQEDLWRYSRIA